MRKNKILEKLLAIILIFTLTSANFAFVTKSFASSLAETLFGMRTDTGHKNVEFEAYFGTEEEKETSVISDVNNEELAISMNLNVKETGYLKDAKIEIAETEEGKGLNFRLKNTGSRTENSSEENVNTENENQENLEETENPFLNALGNPGQNSQVASEVNKGIEQNEEIVEDNEVILPEGVQSIEDNIITLQQVNSSNELKINIPIEYKNELFVNENKFSNDCLIKFTGTYVDDDGEENQVGKEYNLRVSWKDERNVSVTTSTEKYIDYEKGVILQTLVRVDNSTNGKSLPVKESNVIIDVPNYLNVKPSSVSVVANNTMATNGQTPETINFNENNWYYNQDENKLVITVKNEKQLVKVDEFEDEYLKDADKEVIEEERYYNGSSYDEYLITYTYNDVQASSNQEIVSSNIEAKMTTFSGAENEDYINMVANNNNFEYALEGKTGDIVSLYIETETGEVSKAYAYANYNNSDKYEVELKSNTLVNISYKDIINGLSVEDVENVYVSKDGNVIPNNDLYYKQISISKENFTKILGEQGTIKVLDENGTELFTINNETEVNESGFIVKEFGERYSKLHYEISKPVSEGNLVINNVKAMRNASIDKTTLANVTEINTKVAIKADYNYVENRVEVGTVENSVKFNDTTSKVNLVLDRDNLSTLATNTDVEMRLELNNAVDTSDIFGHSIFELTLPESIEAVEVTNTSILYGEGLDITSAELIDGKVIRIEVNGKQEGINSGVLTNGTNIVINANLKVNLFTPAKSENFTLKYSNDEATSYSDNGIVENTIAYSAPTGLVAVNSISNYNNSGSTVTSVRQGEKEDIIDIYAEAKSATMEVVVMNNNNNTVSNLSILGKIPFKGVKDIETEDDLGTTLDTKMLSGVVSDEHNKAAFKIYYSENGEATKDLEDSNNGWTLEPASFETIKSYLIVPVEENYVMNETEILRFTYNFEIPANLTHNEKIYGTFLTYYTNNAEIATTDEKTVPDKVGLTTGAGPELIVETSVSREKMKEFEEVQVDVVATNVGSDRADDVIVELPIPKNSTYVSHNCEKENATVTYENNIVRVTVPSLEREEKVEFSVVLSATANNKDEKPEIEVVSTVSAKDLGAVIKSETKKIEVAQAEFEIKEVDKAEIDEAIVYTEGRLAKLKINVKNLTRNTLNNVIVEKKLPEEFTFEKGYVLGYESDGITSFEEIPATYDESTRIITLKIDSLEKLRSRQIIIEATANALSEDSTKRVVSTTTTVRADGTDTYESNELLLTLAKPVLVFNQTVDKTDTYIKEGETLTYTFTVRNEGDATAKSVVLTDQIPDGLRVQRISYVANGIPVDRKISSNENAVVTADIEPNNELVVNVKALASSLKGAEEKTVTNYATVSATKVEEAQTNSITHIIEANEEYRNVSASGQTNSADTANQATQSNIDKTYRINGIAWLDSNENGTRDDGEELLSGISAKLVNSETGVIQKSVTTDASGNYSFAGISNGTYLIVFDYDTVKYTVTAYNKDGVAANVNSDVVTTKIDQDGKSRNAAITDVITISNGSVSNIDIGLVLADAFDLKLNKTITKVTVQNAKGTTQDEYEGTTFTKTEIASKYLTGSTVYVEYTMTVSNEGDVAGYAKKIIDYVPEGMTFNSSLKDNQGWYTGTDGNLYYTGLADTELKAKESRTIKLILTKQMTEENTGLVNNVAEIYEDYNIYGISDCNSTPGNKAQGENDLGSADISILIKTGETFIYVSVIITTILLGSIVIFIAYNKIVLVKRKGGV